MGKLSRTKGHNFEREVCGWLNKAVPGADAKRVLIETREGNSGDVANTLGLSIQCKVGARPPVYEALHEAIAAAKPGETPIAFIRRNASGKRPKDDLVVMRAENFLLLLEEIHG